MIGCCLYCLCRSLGGKRSDDPSRVGGPEGGLLDMGLGTVIGKDKDGMTSALSKYQNKTAVRENRAHMKKLTSKVCLIVVAVY